MTELTAEERRERTRAYAEEQRARHELKLFQESQLFRDVEIVGRTGSAHLLLEAARQHRHDVTSLWGQRDPLTVTPAMIAKRKNDLATELTAQAEQAAKIRCRRVGEH